MKQRKKKKERKREIERDRDTEEHKETETQRHRRTQKHRDAQKHKEKKKEREKERKSKSRMAGSDPKFGKIWPGSAARALSEDPQNPPQISTKNSETSGPSEDAGAYAAKKGPRRAQPLAASTTGYRYSGSAVHGKYDPDIAPIYRIILII